MQEGRAPETKECCPPFEVEKWEGKEITFNRKRFIMASVPTLFHVPFIPQLKRKIVRLIAKAEEAKKLPAKAEDILLLFRDPSPFKSEMYLSVEGRIAGESNIRLSGEFYTKVYDGPNRDIPKFFGKMKNYLKSMGQRAKDLYVHYAYCPQCAKKFGHNYMVFFARLD